MNVVELRSPPRVTNELQALAGRYMFPDMTAGSTVDRVDGEGGVRRDFLAADRQQCRGRLRAERPRLVVGSPPCTWWSWLLSLTVPKMSEQGWRGGIPRLGYGWCVRARSTGSSCARGGFLHEHIMQYYCRIARVGLRA